MIISKRNYLEKMEMAQPLKSFIDKIIECPDTDLPQVLSSKSTWERPRGDLFHWINVLNKFDLVFAVYIKKYGLDEEYPKLTIMAPEDSNVLIACLQFTTLLFEHCSNRSIYNSSDRLYSLIMTADIDVALAALETCVALGERYVQTGSSKYSAPKAVKMKILQIAKVYPPPVPALFKPDSTAKEKEKDSDNNSDKERLLDHYSLLDTLTGKKYPSKWKSIYFQYFKEPTEEEQRSSKVQNNNKKKRKVAKDEASAPTGASKSNSTSTTSTTISTTVASPSAVGGLTAFALSEDVVKNSSLQEIFDRASATIPPHLWFSFSLHALTIKSFNNKSPRSMKLREKLLRLKCFATGFITCMCLTEFTSSRLFESQPYIFSFLVDLIHPENRKHITREIYYAAIKAMECISLKRSSFGNDLIRCLGGNVNHGILFQCIRAINKKVVNEDDDVWEREYIHFFNMLGNLIDLKTLVPRLTSGGLLTDLMSFFNIKTKYRWLTSAAIHLTNLLLSSSPESFDEFINQSGFQLLIDTIKYEIQFCLENPNYGGGPPTDATVYYKITFRQANYIRNLMKLVLQLIQSEAGDRLRNLFDSPLLGCFNTILTNPTLFGPLIISSIIDSVFYIIHNEPTAYSILNEAKVIDTILDNYDSLFMPSGDLLMLLAEVLGAICLNNDGLSKVIAKQSLEKFFQTFFQLELAKEMAKTDMSSNIGCSIDELGRHYPSLKPIIMKQIKRIVIELPKFANSKLPGVEIYNNATGPNLFLDTRDAIPKLESGSEIYNWDACDLAYLIDNACFFIGGVLQDSSWGDLAMKEIKYNEWASFITLSNAPFDYTTSNGLASLIGVLKFFDEEKRDYGLPCLLKILKEKLNSPEVEAFINYDDYSKSFFEQSETIAYLTDTLKQLNVINILMYTLTEIYINPGLMFHERYHQIGDMFGKDDGISMLAKFGLLLRRCMIEEIVIRTRLPDDMVKHTAPLIEGVNNTTEYPPLQFFIEEPTTTPLDTSKEIQFSAQFKNTLQLRFFMYRFQNYISTVYCSIGRICMHKRQDFVQSGWRRLAVKITLKIGEVMSDLLDTKLPSVKNQQLFLLVLINIALYCLSQRERGNDIIQTSLAISFFQNKFFNKLNVICQTYFHSLLAMDESEAASTRELKYINQTESSMIKNILSQSLMVFAKIVDIKAFPNLPSVKQYFHEGFGDEPEVTLLGCFLVQTKLIGIDLMDKLVSDLTSSAPGIHVTNIPSPVIEQLIYILKHVLIKDNKENYVIEFLGYDVDNVSPPIKLVDQLKKVLSNSQAEHYFKHSNNLVDLANGKYPECPHTVVREEEWDTLAEQLADLDESELRYIPKPEIQYSTPTIGVFKIPNRLLGDQLIKNIITMTTFYPRCVTSMVDILEVVQNSDRDDVLKIVIGEILDLDKEATNKEDCNATKKMNSVMHFLSQYIVDCTQPSKYHDDIVMFMERKLSGVNPNDEFSSLFANSDWFAYGIAVLGIFALYDKMPTPELTIHGFELYFIRKPHLANLLNFLDQLINNVNYKKLDNIKTVLEITKFFTLYTTDYQLTKKLIPTIIQLLQLNRSFIEKNDRQITQQYQLSLICLIRRCFETTEVLRNIMFSELNGLLKGNIRSGGVSSELNNVLRDTKDLAFREQDVFVNILTRDLRLENFDGSKLGQRIKVYRPKESTVLNTSSIISAPEIASEDFNMEDETDATENVTTPISSATSPEPIFESTGILQILLNELMDICKTDWISDPADEEEVTAEKKDEVKKITKEQREANVFKNKNFSYICVLLQTISELLASYKQSKLEFITFSRKKVTENDMKKPRATALNFIIHQLIPTQQLIHKGKQKGSENERRTAVSSLAKLCVLALTSTPILDEENEPIGTKEDPDMAFIRKFYVDIMLKILKETANTNSNANHVLTPSARYSKLMDLSDLSSSLISSKFKELMGPVLNKTATKFDTYYLGKAMIEKQLPSLLGSIISEFDLNFPDINRVIKFCLKPITFLGKIKTEFQTFFQEENQNADADADDDIVPEDNDEDERDETPDLFRHSTLGMYDVESDSEDDEEDGDDFYDDEALEVLMDGEDGSDEEVSEDDDDEVDDDDDDDDDDDMDDEDEEDGLDQDIDMEGVIEGRPYGDEINIIRSGSDVDVVDDDSEVDSEEEDEEDDDEEVNNSDFYDFDDDDESVSEYDDEELDGWIQAFESDTETGTGDAVEEDDDSSVIRNGNAAGIPRGISHRNGHLVRDGHLDMNGYLVDSDSDEEDGEGNAGINNNDDDDGASDNSSIRGDGDSLELGDSRTRARNFANSFFDAILPNANDITARPFASIFGGAFNDVAGNGLLRGSIQIPGTGVSVNETGGGAGGRRNSSAQVFERRVIERILQLDNGSKIPSRDSDPLLHNMYIKSTRERWSEVSKRYDVMGIAAFQRFCDILTPKILNLIADDSLKIFKAKKEKELALKKEHEERIRKRQEADRIRREEEAKARELQSANDPSLVQEPIMVMIGDREVDISGTDIDPEFFEALPDDMREEVFTQHVRERRANANTTGGDTREIDPDFLDALPDHLREEILQQELMARRFGSLDDLDDDEGEEDEEEEENDALDGQEDVDGESTRISDGNANPVSTDGAAASKNAFKTKKFFTPLLERPGVASLIRLLFIPQPMNQRESIHTALDNLCHNKQTRGEVMNLLISILQDGLTSQKLIEKSFIQVTIRARGKHQQPLLQNQQQQLIKSAEGGISSQFPVGATPLIIGNQIIEAILHLLDRNVLMRYYLLTEHENVYKKKQDATSVVGKEGKYPINYLLSLLENEAVKSEQPFLDVLALVFQIATRPLHTLQKATSAPFTTPYIPEQNFRNLIQILISHDCSKTTFRTTISAMQNLSVLPNAQKVFSDELSDQATVLGKTLINELSALTKEISESGSNDPETTSLSKFSASSSDQAKLLRILTALDYMFESKQSKDKKLSEGSNSEGSVVGDEEIEELTGLYKKLALGSLWDALSEILRVLGEKQDILTNVSTALLPLIELLMVVCKHSKVKDLPIKDVVVKYDVTQKRIDFTKEPIENLFFSFTDEHKKILNQMVRSNPNLMSGPFGMLVRNPRVLEFDNKKNYFDRMLHKVKDEHPKLQVNIRRDQVFLDSYRALFFKPLEEFRNSKLEITFKGEAGVDAGGVTREWYQVLSRQMFNPDYALFTPVASDETTFHPNRTSYVNPEHLSFFKFIGRIIGKAIYDNSFLDCHFSRAVYKRLLSRPVSLKDMETLDLEYFKSLMWMLENDITDVITEDFSVETDDYGEHKIIELIPNGANIPVTEENKYDYVKKIVEYRLQTSITEQMDNFLIGFHEIIPKDLVSIFDEQELELLISGLPDIDVDDWKNNTTYSNYSPSSPQIQWFWRAIKSFDTEERAKLLQFATGTSKVPLNGFKELSGANGTCKFSIHRDYSSTDRLPLSHTCFNQIDLPAYELYEALRGNLLLALTEGHEGFGLA